MLEHVIYNPPEAAQTIILLFCAIGAALGFVVFVGYHKSQTSYKHGLKYGPLVVMLLGLLQLAAVWLFVFLVGYIAVTALVAVGWFLGL